jgi:glycosyltransferase involved in cell wall biosynthesis
MIVISCALDSSLWQSKMQGILKPHMERYQLFENFDQVTILTQDTKVFTNGLGKIKHVPCAHSRFKVVRTLLARASFLRWIYFSCSSLIWLQRNRAQINLLIAENVDSPTPFLFSSLSKIPLYIHYHYDVSTQVSKINKREFRGLILLSLEKLVLKRAAGVWVTATSLATKAKAFGAKKVTLLPNWIDFNQSPKQILDRTEKSSGSIVFVGRLHPVKRVPMLIEAFAQVNKTFPSTVLNIVGDGEERQNLTELTKRLNLEKSVNFMGFQNHDRVLEIMSQSDLIVLPSKMEGNPRVLVEAMMLKVPIIAANIPGIKEIVKHDETGYLMAGESPKDLASAIDFLLTNRQYVAKITKNAYEFAEQRFSKEQALKRIAKDICPIIPSYQTENICSLHISPSQ